MNARLRPWAVLALLLLTGAQSACQEKSGEAATQNSADAGQVDEAVPVELSEAGTGAIRQTIMATATVAARHEVFIQAEARGMVREVKAEEGDQVTQGQLLSRLTNPELELTVPQAASNVGRLRREVANLEPLIDKGYVSRQSYEELKYQLTQATEALQRARAQVAALQVRSPLGGLVARRAVTPGQQVNPGQELFHVVDPTQLEVVVNVPERELGRIQEGAASYVTSEALNGARFEGAIRLINPIVNAQTGTVKVTIALQGPPEGSELKGRRLRPGMFVSVFIITDTRDQATLIPKRAVIYKDDATYVMVAQDEGDAMRARLTPIKTGFSQDDRVEVTEGVSAGDRVVVLGQTGLKDNAEIKVVQ